MLVKIPNSEALAMLEQNNQINGSILSFSANLQADQMENVHMVMDFTDVIQKYSIGTAIVANTDFYEENPDICEAILKIQQVVLENWEEDFDENAEILASQYECEVEDVKELMQTQKPTDKLTGYNNLATLLYEAGMLNNELKLEDLSNYDKLPK